MQNKSLRLALLGYPIQHSLSPALFAYFGQQTGTDIEYLLWERPPQAILKEDLQNTLEQYDLDALNITSPYKHEILNLLDYLSPTAMRLQAVNFLWREDSQLYGTNTDITGAHSLISYTSIPKAQLPVLVLGAGGASRPVLEALYEQKIAILCSNRTPEKAQALASDFDADYLPWDALNKIRQPVILFSVLPHQVGLPAIAAECVREVVDVAYTASRTQAWARAHKIRYNNGYRWLFAQAVECFQILRKSQESPTYIAQECLPRIAAKYLSGNA